MSIGNSYGMFNTSNCLFGIMSDVATSFSEWLNKQINARDWSQAKTASAAGISKATVSDLLSGKVKPGFDVSIGLANGFNLPAVEVLREAGLLPTVPARTAQHEQLLHLFDQLSEQEKKEVLGYVKFKARGNR